MNRGWNWPQATKRGCTNSQAAELAADWRNFYTSLLDGVERFAGLSGPARWTSKLPEEYHEAAEAAIYVVYSYRTPIGWVNPDGTVTVPDVGYSLSTGQHQWYLIDAWRDRLPSGFTIAARGRRLVPSGGGRRNGGMDDPYPAARYNGPDRGTVARDREAVARMETPALTTEQEYRRRRAALEEQQAEYYRSEFDRREPAGAAGYDRSGLPIEPRFDPYLPL